jgi:hypothetical protein
MGAEEACVQFSSTEIQIWRLFCKKLSSKDLTAVPYSVYVRYLKILAESEVI